MAQESEIGMQELSVNPRVVVRNRTNWKLYGFLAGVILCLSIMLVMERAGGCNSAPNPATADVYGMKAQQNIATEKATESKAADVAAQNNLAKSAVTSDQITANNQAAVAAAAAQTAAAQPTNAAAQAAAAQAQAALQAASVQVQADQARVAALTSLQGQYDSTITQMKAVIATQQIQLSNRQAALDAANAKADAADLAKAQALAAVGNTVTGVIPIPGVGTIITAVIAAGLGIYGAVQKKNQNATSAELTQTQSDLDTSQSHFDNLAHAIATVELPPSTVTTKDSGGGTTTVTTQTAAPAISTVVAAIPADTAKALNTSLAALGHV